MIKKVKYILNCSVILLACWLLQFSFFIFEKSVSFPIKVKTTIPNVFEIDITTLPQGYYYLSLGRPRAHCNASMAKNLLFRGHSAKDNIRENLGVGFSFQKNMDNSILIDCSKIQTGFKSKVASSPVITNLMTGKVLQFLRELIDIYLPFILSVGILCFGIFKFYSSKFKDIKFGIIGLVAFSYAASLSYITRLFFEGTTASYIHVITKGTFCYVAFMLISNFFGKKYSLFKLGFLACLLGLIFPISGQIILHDYYKINFLFYTCTFGYLFYQSIKLNAEVHLKSLTLTWFIIQCFDYITLLKSTGSYYAPVFFCITLIMITYSFNEFNELKNQTLKINQLILATIQKKSPFQTLQILTNELLKLISFERFSIYIDDYYNGKNSKKFSTCSRISEYGYKKETEKDIQLSFDEGRGSFIVQTLKTNNLLIQKSEKDNCWFLLIPINQIICICISNHDSEKKINLQTLNKIIHLLDPSFKGIALSLEGLASNLHHSLSKLKSKLPPGIFEREIGAIFIDIYNYSKQCEDNGDEYAKFISSTYFPAIMKYMSSYATPEVVRGDEIYFVVVKDLSTVEGTIYEQSHEALKNLNQFIQTIGPELCKNHGFMNQEFRIGASIGTGNIVVDDVMVRTSGDHINRAKRLQDSALKNEILIEGNSFDQLPKTNIISLNRRTIVVKKNVVDAVRIGFKNAA